MKNEKFHGYSSAAGCFICVFCNLGIASTVGVFLPYLAAAIGSSVGACAQAVTVATVAAFATSFFVPKITGKFGGKGTLYLALLLIIPYLMVPAFATHIWMVMAYGLFGGLFLCLGTTVTNSIIISKWFIKKRSSILGIVLGGGAFGAAVFQYLAGLFCELWGIKVSYLILLACGTVLPGLANMLLIKDPDKLGQKPLGWEETMGEKTAGSAKTELPGVTFAAAQKSMSFWLCLIAIICSGPLITGFQTFATSYWRSFGMEGGAASTWVSIWSAIGCIAVIALGQIANKWGNKVFITIINVCYIIGMIFAILWPTNQTTSYTILAVLFVGFSYPLTTSVPATLCTESFGPKEYSKIISWFSAALYLGKAFASPMISAIVTATGSYVNAFIILAVLSAVSLVLIIISIVTSPYQKIIREQRALRT
jgi:MFS family permease